MSSFWPGDNMDQQSASHAAEIAVLRQAYAALNLGDTGGFVKDFDPQIVRVEPADVPEDGIFRGLEAVMAHVSHHRANWAEGGCEPQQFRVFGDRILVSVRVRVRLKHEPEWREGQVSDVFEFRGGKVMQFRTFWDEAQALAWAAESADAG